LPGKKYYFWRNLPVRKFRVLKIWIILFLSIFFFRLFHIQILKGNYYWKKAEENRIQYFYIPAPRGRIFDRNGTELAGNQPGYSLYVALRGLNNALKDKIAIKISEIINFPKEKVLERFKSKDILPFEVIRLMSHLSRDEIAKIEENMHHLPQTSIQIEPLRKYPLGTNGAHLLGYIGEINKLELSKLKKYGYKLKDKIGKSGIEKVYDRQLRGYEGYQEIEVEVSGNHCGIVKSCNPKIGNDLLLTIDWKLQQAAKKAMGDRAGAVVAMNPKSGEILVWLSQPGFNPQHFTLPLTQDRAKEIFQNPEHPLFDRIIKGQYAPGSIFKLITAMTALESDDENINREYVCNRSITVGYDRKVFRCWKNKKHGKLSLIEAIANSCNVYFYQLGMDMGVENMYKTAKKMGFGEISQNIFEGESKGLIPNSKWKKTQFNRGWYPGDNANMSVGQGYVLVSPMQLLKMISTIATNGEMYVPHFVKMIVSPERKIIKKNKPRIEKHADISEFTFEKIKEGMRGVTEYGTAQFLNIPLEVAGKTGTAEAPGGKDNAWFACFAPIDDPQIAIVVLVENGGYGSVAAMPVAREILKEKFLKEKH
jgi:penicillin-binding protein 2